MVIGAWACEAGCFANNPQPDLSEGLGELDIKAETLRYVVCATSDLLQDSVFDVESWLFRRVSECMRATINAAVLLGDGVGKPMGLLNPNSGIPICDVSPATPAGQFSWQGLEGEHLVELVHQKDRAARRRLDALRLTAFDRDGCVRLDRAVDPGDEILDVATLLDEPARQHGRLLVVFDARYDPQIFPYRPHHYGYLHRHDSVAPPLYYAINATLGGVPDRIGAVALNNFETYLFLDRAQRG